MKISMIAAIGKNRELGKDNKLLWNIPEDMKHFRDITKDHPVIMGRKTFESIGKPLPDRTNIIITQNSEFNAKGVIIVNSLEGAIKTGEEKECKEMLLRGVVYDEAISKRDRHSRPVGIAMTKKKREIFIIGGGQVYAQGIKYADKLYLTLIDASFDADSFFPDYSEFKICHDSGPLESSGFKYRFVELEKRYL